MAVIVRAWRICIHALFAYLMEESGGWGSRGNYMYLYRYVLEEDCGDNNHLAGCISRRR